MPVIRLRWKLVLVFLAATLLPLAAILWVGSALMARSLAFVRTDDLATLSSSLEQVAREYYGESREALREEAASGRLQPERFPAAARSGWPAAMQQFWDSGEADRVVLSEPDGDRLEYLRRHDGEVWRYTRPLGGVRLARIARQLQGARSHAAELRERDLPRGFTLALVLSSAVIWVAALGVVVFVASRISTPVEQLTAGLARLAGGRFDARLAPAGRDEIGRAIEAFNRTAGELQENRNRLVYLAQVASWQMLARKMAHELKNSLTPIRLTVEEIAARRPVAESAFLEQAVRIVSDEVETLERRVRAFSEFAAEPPVHPSAIDITQLLDERVRFLRAAHPDVAYRTTAAAGVPAAWADADQVKGILTNLLENAAEAAGAGGTVLARTGVRDGNVLVEVHDSGPGLSPEARAMLFEPSISFKQHGMGLGLAISRKNALMAGGDLTAIDGCLGGAGFRLALPSAAGSDRRA
jgi:two-component system nitrogen regulation sensor histidine kinase NtrY